MIIACSRHPLFSQNSPGARCHGMSLSLWGSGAKGQGHGGRTLPGRGEEHRPGRNRVVGGWAEVWKKKREIWDGGWGGRRAGRGDQKRWASNLATSSHQPPQISPLCLARGTGLQAGAGGAPRGQAGSGGHPQHPSARPPRDAHRPPNPILRGGVAGTRGTKERPGREKGGQEPWPPPRGGFTGC